jgi:hypothetical protein
MTTVLSKMLELSPAVHIRRIDASRYRCTWTVYSERQNLLGHAIGAGIDPYIAIGQAWKHAVSEGWVKP